MKNLNNPFSKKLDTQHCQKCGKYLWRKGKSKHGKEMTYPDVGRISIPHKNKKGWYRIIKKKDKFFRVKAEPEVLCRKCLYGK